MPRIKNRRQVKKIVELRDRKHLSFRAISRILRRSVSTIHEQYIRYKGVDN